MKKNKENPSHEMFLDTWKLVHANPRMFHYRIKKHPFSIFEKKILMSFYLYNKNKKEEPLELLHFKIQDDSFLEGIRYYLKGLIYNQHGHYYYAIENLKNSIDYFIKQDNCPFIINSLCLLANVYANRRDIENTAKTLDQLSDIKPQNDSQKLQKQYAQMCYYSITGQTKKAVLFFQDIKKQNNSQFEIYKPYLLVNLFNLYAADLNFKKCSEILNEYKKISGCLVKANYLYMKILLEHITQDTPLYIYNKDFKGFPELFNQLKVINYLKSGDIEGAKKHWDFLQKHNKFLYSNNFNYLGEKTLFYQSLEKNKKNNVQTNIDEKKLKILSTNLEKIAYIFSVNAAPIHNEVLIKLIWNEELTELNLNRLRKLVSDYSKKYSLKIKAFDCRYQLQEKTG
jgi:hypothetical protein